MWNDYFFKKKNDDIIFPGIEWGGNKNPKIIKDDGKYLLVRTTGQKSGCDLVNPERARCSYIIYKRIKRGILREVYFLSYTIRTKTGTRKFMLNQFLKFANSSKLKKVS